MTVKMRNNRSEKHHNWKGDDATLVAKHIWVKTRLGTPKLCSKCGFTSENTYHFDWSNISGEYKRDLSDWQRLCKKCHHKFDNLVEKRQTARRKRIEYSIIQLTDNECIGAYETLEEASRITGIGRTSISNNLSGLSEKAGGYFWVRGLVV